MLLVIPHGGAIFEFLLARPGGLRVHPFLLQAGLRLLVEPVRQFWASHPAVGIGQTESSLWVAAAVGLGHPFRLEEEPVADESFYNRNIYPVLSEYFPCFTNLRPVNMWAGFYDVNSLDSTPIVARVGNCIITAGLSGSGIMKADSVGRIAAALLDDKDEATLFGNRTVPTANLGLVNRAVENEKFVI